MSILQFNAPPLPHFIAGGFAVFEPGQQHLNRKNIGVFDLLIVTHGCLYIGEEDRRYEVSAGHALILRPDRHHYPAEACAVETGHYWLHFNTLGKWGQADESAARPEPVSTTNTLTMETFTLLIPQFVRFLQPSSCYEKLHQLLQVRQTSYSNEVRWRQQLIFQEILELLSASLDVHATAPGVRVADQAASYLRMHYKEDISAKMLGESLNFHPVYIARCMQKEFGCSPFEYLMQYRLEQAKLLLLQTDLPVARIAEQVGFQQPSYFSSSFTKYEKISPRDYRKRFRFMLE
ncbi:helix-turn-helix transcriptional regulator [Paenibacillus xerothermodurans]|uniref:AraC family transcriptional regulator n=1 Tax=Paenibacillus xerothermodurans TaxID=1977292 RepID=A0A2W1NVB2_PAEXE|nr:AraC family transcriptional regulator [Paenibacillus xerothermodurans]PZE21706.1 AraC family transcriptional regulator [Paenibacillus xerothermodurans]